MLNKTFGKEGVRILFFFAASAYSLYSVGFTPKLRCT